MSDIEDYPYFKLGFIQATRARMFEKDNPPPEFIDEIVLGFYDSREDDFVPDGVATQNVRGIISISWKEKIPFDSYWITLEVPDTSWYLLRAYIPVMVMLSELDLEEGGVSPEELCDMFRAAGIPDLTDEE